MKGWQIDGTLYPENPVHDLEQVYFDVRQLWLFYRSGGMGGSPVLPDAGGINDQSSWLIEAFSIMSNFEETLRAK